MKRLLTSCSERRANTGLIQVLITQNDLRATLICHNWQVDRVIFLLLLSLRFTTCSLQVILTCFSVDPHTSISTAVWFREIWRLLLRCLLWVFSPKSIRMILLARGTIRVSVFFCWVKRVYIYRCKNICVIVTHFIFTLYVANTLSFDIQCKRYELYLDEIQCTV